MKVLQINSLGATLSTGRTTREMHEYFQHHGIESYIATACNKDCDDAYPISTMNGMHIDVLLSIITGLEGYHSRYQTRRFLKYIEKIKPDIVHLRNLHNAYINLGMLLRYLAKKDIATVVTMHDVWFMTGKCCVYNVYPCEKWKTGCSSCPAMKDDARKRWFDRSSRMWKDKKKWFGAIPRLAVVGNSQWCGARTKESFLKSAKYIDYIYNWIDFSVFYPRDVVAAKEELGLQDKRIILGVSAVWSETGKKGFRKYLELAAVLPEEYHIVLVGTLNYKGELPKNVTVIPQTHNAEELATYYSMADVYLNLSEGETFGKVSAEAVSCGTPVIAVDVTANREIVPPNAGVVIKTADVNEILAALNTVLSKDKEDYLAACLEFSREHFDKEKNIEKYIQIYQQLLNN